MEEIREFRDRSADTSVVPREVYYRCVWLVRDMERLKAISDLRSSLSDERDILISEAVISRACADIRHIETALGSVPEVYRTGVIGNIASGTPFSDLAHPNTWKKWKRIFIAELAKELDLI